MTSRALTIRMQFSVAFSGQMELHSGLPYVYLVDHAVPRVPELTSFYLVYCTLLYLNLTLFTLIYPRLVTLYRVYHKVTSCFQVYSKLTTSFHVFPYTLVFPRSPTFNPS